MANGSPRQDDEPDTDKRLEWLRHGGNPDRLGIARVDGRLDFRGVDARQLRLRIGHRRWQGIDFSNARLPRLMFRGSTVRDCRFDGADLTDGGSWQSSFEDCSFVWARMRDWTFSGNAFFFRHDSRYVRCDFSRADLRGNWATNAIFEDCLFDHTRLDKVEFHQCRVTRCTFRGPLVEAGFYGAMREGEDADAVRDCDFSGTDFSWTYFKQLNLAGVRWPEGPGHTVLEPWRPTLECAIRQLAARMDDAKRAGNTNEFLRIASASSILETDLEFSGPRQERGVIAHSNLDERAPNLRDEVIALLLSCQERVRRDRIARPE